MRRTLFFGVLLGILFVGCNSRKKTQEAVKVDQGAKTKATTVAETHTIDAFGQVTDSLQVKEHKVKPNESFYQILAKYDFSPRQIYSITQKASDIINLKGLKPGQKYRTYALNNGQTQIEKMVWQPNPVDYVVFDQLPDTVQIYKAARPLSTKLAVASGEIDNSLFQAIKREQASPLLAYKLADVFAWEIDFYRLRKGDSFKALYDKKYIGNNFYDIGDIEAAQFSFRGKTYRAYRFAHGDFDGYFNKDGHSVEKALLKMPFKFSQRITSRFSRHRMNPVLHKVMPHHGVDYGAPRGTPVLATGNGTVLEAHYGGASGNIVKIRHNRIYTTVYMHLNRFAKGVHAGTSVKQGQVIGYVGSTGRSTGPHLHYAIYKNGRYVNPLTVDLPSAKSVPDSLMNDFAQIRDSLNHKMQQMLIEKQQDRYAISQVAK